MKNVVQNMQKAVIASEAHLCCVFKVRNLSSILSNRSRVPSGTETDSKHNFEKVGNNLIPNLTIKY